MTISKQFSADASILIVDEKCPLAKLLAWTRCADPEALRSRLARLPDVALVTQQFGFAAMKRLVGAGTGAAVVDGELFAPDGELCEEHTHPLCAALGPEPNQDQDQGQDQAQSGGDRPAEPTGSLSSSSSSAPVITAVAHQSTSVSPQGGARSPEMPTRSPPTAGSNQNKHITDVLEHLQAVYAAQGGVDQYRLLTYKRCISALKKMDTVTDVEQVGEMRWRRGVCVLILRRCKVK